MISRNSLHMQGMKTIIANANLMQKGGCVGLRPGQPPPSWKITMGGHVGFRLRAPPFCVRFAGGGWGLWHRPHHGILQKGMRHRIAAMRTHLMWPPPIEKHSGKIIAVPRRERERALCGQAFSVIRPQIVKPTDNLAQEQNPNLIGTIACSCIVYTHWICFPTKLWLWPTMENESTVATTDKWKYEYLISHSVCLTTSFFTLG